MVFNIYYYNIERDELIVFIYLFVLHWIGCIGRTL